MAFKVMLASASDIPHEPMHIQIDGDGFSHRLQFGPPGTALTHSIDLPPYGQLNLRLAFNIDKDNAKVAVHNIRGDDALVAFALPGRRFYADILHIMAPSTPCYVECADGKRSQHCIVCDGPAISVKLCC